MKETVFGDEIAGEGTTEKLETMVGYGAVLVIDVASESSMFLTYDAVAKKSLVTLIKPLEEKPAPGLKPSPNGPKRFQATMQAVCIVSTAKDVFAGFSEMPQVAKEFKIAAKANLVCARTDNTKQQFLFTKKIRWTRRTKKSREGAVGVNRWITALVVAFISISSRFCFAGPTPVVGEIPGKFNVSLSGSSNYSIPIKIAPGAAGTQPQIQINYDSQNLGGPLGAGWSLGGISAITRGPRDQFAMALPGPSTLTTVMRSISTGNGLSPSAIR